jgi:hypothetical protein
LIAVFLLAAASLGFLAAAAADDPRAREVQRLRFELEPPVNQQRELRFPDAFSIGAIFIGKQLPTGQEGGRPARGTVIVPAGQLTRFIPSQNFYRDPAILGALSPNALDSITISTISMYDKDEGLCDRCLSHISHLKGLIELNIDRSDASDKGAAYAAQLPRLQRLTAFGTSIDGSFLNQLGTLKHLRSLTLAANGLKEENLKYLVALPNLRYLNLCGCDIGDEGVRAIANCKSLIEVGLADNPRITDKSIPYLLSLKKLRILNVHSTAITPKEVVRLNILPLVLIGIPRRPMINAEYLQVQKAFPGAFVTLPGKKVRNMDGDNKVLLAPLH